MISEARRTRRLLPSLPIFVSFARVRLSKVFSEALKLSRPAFPNPHETSISFLSSASRYQSPYSSSPGAGSDLPTGQQYGCSSPASGKSSACSDCDFASSDSCSECERCLQCPDSLGPAFRRHQYGSD